jgi:SAM-dependent methyltransferase
MAEHNELYRQAYYYDIVFHRDVSREVNFIGALFQQRTGRALESVLDIACGPAYHARAFARRGVRAAGLDLRKEMIDFARDQAAAEGVTLEWIVGDMREFTLLQPVDVAFTLFDGLDSLQTNDEIVRHFRAVATHLKAGGLYLIDATHPRDCSPFHYPPFQYRGERGGCRVEVDWVANPSLGNPLMQVVAVEVTMRVSENGREQVFTDRACERFLFPPEIAALADLSGALKVCGWYGDFDLNQPLDDTPASRRMITVLQKNDAGGWAGEKWSAYFSPKLCVQPHPRKGGSGVFARQPVAAGELLVVWGGRAVTGAQLATLTGRERRHSLQVEEDLYLAPVGPPEPGDYVCHSCDPNAGLSGQIALVALREIAPGEEVCYDYAMSDGSDYDEFDCACGSSLCRGRITGDDWQRPELQARYAGYFSPYLQRRIERLSGR